MPLTWKVFLINGAVFLAGTVALVLSPASVSRRVLISEAVVLAVGLSLMLATNAVLLRVSLAPLDRVIREMASVDLLETGHRLEVIPGSGPGAALVTSFNAMIERLEVERSTSNARALAAQEAERHRIAQELHDEVGQRLTVVLLGLKQVQQHAPPELVDELGLVRESARAGLDDVRRVARQLRPGVLEDLGLANALSSLANDFAQGGGARVRRVVAPGLPPLSAQAELVIYRVAQEALTNAARHARAREVALSLTRVGAEVVLVVSDDGRGGDLSSGAGVRGMRERSRLVGASLSITSGPGGTEVRLGIPVRPVVG